MLTTWIDAKRNVQVVHRSYVEDITQADTPDGYADLTEIEVGEDSTGLLTIYVRQLRNGLDPVAVKFVGPEDELQARADEIAAADRAQEANEVAAQRER